MEYINEVETDYNRLSNNSRLETENLIKEQLIQENPQLAYDLQQLRQEILKRIHNITTGQ